MSDIQTKDFAPEGTGEVPSVTSTDVVVLYDPQDGRVVHMHHAITFNGVERSKREVQEQNAVEIARRLDCNVDDLKILHVPNFDAQGSMFRVDVDKQVLVELEEATSMLKTIRKGRPHQR